MRTTVTLDPDAEQLLRQAMQQTGESFKATLNRAIRRGLADTVVEVEEEPFVVKAKDMGLRPGIDLTNLGDLLTEWDVEAHLEVTRKLEERQARAKAEQRKPDAS